MKLVENYLQAFSLLKFGCNGALDPKVSFEEKGKLREGHRENINLIFLWKAS